MLLLLTKIMHVRDREYKLCCFYQSWLTSTNLVFQNQQNAASLSDLQQCLRLPHCYFKPLLLWLIDSGLAGFFALPPLFLNPLSSALHRFTK